MQLSPTSVRVAHAIGEVTIMIQPIGPDELRAHDRGDVGSVQLPPREEPAPRSAALDPIATPEGRALLADVLASLDGPHGHGGHAHGHRGHPGHGHHDHGRHHGHHKRLEEVMESLLNDALSGPTSGATSAQSTVESDSTRINEVIQDDPTVTPAEVAHLLEVADAASRGDPGPYSRREDQPAERAREEGRTTPE